MKNKHPFRDKLKSLGRFAMAASLLGLASVQMAVASAPAAGTPISNRASVTFLDSSLNRQTVDSNDVVTIVQQVGAFTLSPIGNRRQGGAGSTVYVQYTLQNTGNGNDTFRVNVADLPAPAANFRNIEVFVDNGNGQPQGSALCSSIVGSTAPVCSAGFTRQLDAGASLNFVVAYSIPADAATSWGAAANNIARVTAQTATTDADLLATYSPSSITSDDTIEFTANAAFSLVQALAAPGPGVTPSVGTDWPIANSGPRGTTTTLTITYRNNGGASGNLFLKNTIPSGFDFVAGSAVVSCAPGVGLSDTNAITNQALCGDAGIGFEVDSGVLSAVVPNVPVNSIATLSYQVTVKSTASFGTSDTSSTVNFATCTAGNTLADCASTSPLNDSNTVRFTVLANRNVALNAADTTPGTPNAIGDNITTVNIVPGRPSFQTHTITNNGEAADTFNLTINAGNFPAGTEFVWFNEDAANPGRPTTALGDSNGDGIVDTAAIGAGDSKNLVLRIIIPQNTTVAANVNYRATATATSINLVNGVAASDTTNISATNVIGGLVDITNPNRDPLAGPGDPDYSIGPVPAGGDFIEVPIVITNNDTQDNDFKIESSTDRDQFPGNLPAGWSVVYSSTACNAPPLTPIDPTSIEVKAGESQTVFACVSTPTDAPSGDTSIYFKVTANKDASDGSRPSDIAQADIKLEAAGARSMSLSSGSNQTLVPGGSSDFILTLSNTGQFSCAANPNRLRVVATLPTERTSEGWTVSVFRRGFNADGTPATTDTNVIDETLLGATGGLEVGASLDFIVRVFAPAGANEGLNVSATITVTEVDGSNNIQANPDGCGTQSTTVSVSTISSLLSVLKTHYVDATCGTFDASKLVNTTQRAAPGECINYQVVVRNNGASPVTNVAITDRAPFGSSLRTGPGSTLTCTSTGLSGDALVAGSSSDVVTCNSGSGSNTLNPAGTITLRFEVQVNQ